MLPPLWPTARRRFGWSMLRSARFAAGLTQEELAREVGASRMTISRLERSRSLPSLSLAIALARRLQVCVEELFPDDDLR